MLPPKMRPTSEPPSITRTAVTAEADPPLRIIRRNAVNLLKRSHVSGDPRRGRSLQHERLVRPVHNFCGQVPKTRRSPPRSTPAWRSCRSPRCPHLHYRGPPARALAQPSAIVRGQNAGMGRPSKLTKQTEADLTLLLARGVPVKLAAAATDVSPRSVRRWLHEGDLRERVAEVKAADGVAMANPSDATAEARMVVLLLRVATTGGRAPGGWSGATRSAGALRGCRTDDAELPVDPEPGHVRRDRAPPRLRLDAPTITATAMILRQCSWFASLQSRSPQP